LGRAAAEALEAERSPPKKGGSSGGKKKRKRNVCEHPGCTIQSIFGFERKKPRWCMAHKQEDAVDVWNTRKNCEVEGCTRQATVGPRGDHIGYRIARRCGTHGRPLGWRRRAEWLKQPDSEAPAGARNRGKEAPTCRPCKKPRRKVPAPVGRAPYPCFRHLAGDGDAERRDKADAVVASAFSLHGPLVRALHATPRQRATGAGSAESAPPPAPGGAAREESRRSDIRAAEAAPGREPGDGPSRTQNWPPLLSSPTGEPRAKAGELSAPADAQGSPSPRSTSSSHSAEDLLQLLCDSSAFRLPDKWQVELRLLADEEDLPAPDSPEAPDSGECLPSTVVAAGAPAPVPTARVLALP